MEGYLLVGKAPREEYSRGVKNYAEKRGVRTDRDNIRLTEPSGALVLEAVYSPEKKGFVAVSPYRDELVSLAEEMGYKLEKAGIFELKDLEKMADMGIIRERDLQIIEMARNAASEALSKSMALRMVRKQLEAYNDIIERSVRIGETNAELAQKEYDRLLSNMSMMATLESYDL